MGSLVNSNIVLGVSLCTKWPPILMMNLFMWSEDSRVVKLMAANVIVRHSPMPQTSGNDLSMRATQWRGLSGAGGL
mgnify:CR=1 FL=1